MELVAFFFLPVCLFFFPLRLCERTFLYCFSSFPSVSSVSSVVNPLLILILILNLIFGLD